jgi:hypothetical protein
MLTCLLLPLWLVTRLITLTLCTPRLSSPSYLVSLPFHPPSLEPSQLSDQPVNAFSEAWLGLSQVMTSTFILSPSYRPCRDDRAGGVAPSTAGGLELASIPFAILLGLASLVLPDSTHTFALVSWPYR